MRKAAKPAAAAPTMGPVVEEFEDRKATAEEVRAHADAIRRHAATIGVTNLRLADHGTLVVHSKHPGLREVMDLSFLASEEVGAYVHVIPDDSPSVASAPPL